MKIAVVGSRNITVENLEEYLSDCDAVISGGAKGVDLCAKEYALQKGIPYVEYLPEYRRYGRGAPLVRNRRIVDESDFVLIFWDGVSKGTRYVMEYAKKQGKPRRVVLCQKK